MSIRLGTLYSPAIDCAIRNTASADERVARDVSESTNWTPNPGVRAERRDVQAAEPNRRGG